MREIETCNAVVLQLELENSPGQQVIRTGKAMNSTYIEENKGIEATKIQQWITKILPFRITHYAVISLPLF